LGNTYWICFPSEASKSMSGYNAAYSSVYVEGERNAAGSSESGKSDEAGGAV
jgi:hypothetical protein